VFLVAGEGNTVMALMKSSSEVPAHLQQPLA
jgi:hypothetical protein